MRKGVVVAAVVVGGVAILGIAGVAMASTKPLILPNLAPPPPPPAPDSLGRALVVEGGKALDELGKNEYVKTYTGGGKNYAKEFAINPYYATAKAGTRVVKKIFGSLF